MFSYNVLSRPRALTLDEGMVWEWLPCNGWEANLFLWRKGVPWSHLHRHLILDDCLDHDSTVHEPIALLGELPGIDHRRLFLVFSMIQRLWLSWFSIYLNAAWEGEVFVQDIGECFLPVLPPKRCTPIKHFIHQYTWVLWLKHIEVMKLNNFERNKTDEPGEKET